MIYLKQSLRGVIVKNVFLNISKNSQRNTCAGVSIDVAGFIKNGSCFPVSFSKWT